MDRVKKYLKLKGKSILLHVFLILLMITILPIGTKMLLNIFQEQELTHGIYREIYAEGIKSALNLFVIVETVEFALGVRLYMLSGSTRKEIFKMSAIFILGISFLYALIIGVFGEIGFKLKATGFVFENIEYGQGVKFFIDYFMQFLVISWVINCIVYAFKSSNKVGVGALIIGIAVFYIVDIVETMRLTTTLTIVMSLVLLGISVLGSKKILDYM